MSELRLEFPTIPDTEAAGRIFCDQLDRQIEEVSNKLHNLQTLRRATAETFGIDRREDAGAFASMRDRANRAEFEGEGDPVGTAGRMVPRAAKVAS